MALTPITTDDLADAIVGGATVRATPTTEGMPYTEGVILGHTPARNVILLRGLTGAGEGMAEDSWEVELVDGITLAEVT